MIYKKSGKLNKILNEKGRVSRIIIYIGKAIESVFEKVENNKRIKFEIVVFLLYIAGQICMIFVHEPGADEALPWLIARDSSIYEVIFVVPHYEITTSLWYLVIMPFAKLSAPYELSLNILNLTFSGFAMWLLIFKSPIKRIIKLILPFTYFPFFQFGVINTGESMMMFAFAILAMNFKHRNIKPFIFISSLIFLSACGIFPAVMAAGISLIWLIDIVTHKTKTENNKKLRKNNFIFLLAFFVYLIFLILRIIPTSDSYIKHLNAIPGHSIFIKLGYALLGSISDIFVTNTFFESGYLAQTTLDSREFVVAIIIGAVICILFIRRSIEKKQILLFIVPMTMFSIAACWMPFVRQNIGIVLLFLMFLFWVSEDERNVLSDKSVLDKRIVKEDTEKKSRIGDYDTLKAFGLIVLIILIMINLYWSISSCILDIFNYYSYGRAEYEYLKDNGLTDKEMLVRWEESIPRVDDGCEAITYSNMALELEPYLNSSKNQYYILNSVYALKRSYARFGQIPSEKETEDLKYKLVEKGRPYVIVGTAAFMSIYSPNLVNLKDYDVPLSIEAGSIWKGIPENYEENVYVLKYR
ncbi:MAG: hypothetical protein IKW90_05275 [Lachnospiraceae bacterium]|nr:hypothetical protein [Lachnospiraceae bacterium]